MILRLFNCGWEGTQRLKPGLPLLITLPHVAKWCACAWCREHSLTDALEVSYNVLRIQFLTAAGEAFCSAPTWQAAEAALFALRCPPT